MNFRIPKNQNNVRREAAQVGETRTGQTGIGEFEHRFPAGPKSDARTSGAGEAESQRKHWNRTGQSGATQPSTCQRGPNAPCLIGAKPSRLSAVIGVKVPKEKLFAAEPTASQFFKYTIHTSRCEARRQSRLEVDTRQHSKGLERDGYKPLMRNRTDNDAFPERVTCPRHSNQCRCPRAKAGT